MGGPEHVGLVPDAWGGVRLISRKRRPGGGGRHTGRENRGKSET